MEAPIFIFSNFIHNARSRTLYVRLDGIFKKRASLYYIRVHSCGPLVRNIGGQIRLNCGWIVNYSGPTIAID